MSVKKKSKKKKAAVEMTLWDVILSYPDLHDPKPYKGKVYYRTDVLLESDHAQLKELRKHINAVKVQTWGDDKSEWPEQKKLVQDGNEREDQKSYKDRFYITASTQTPVPVVDPKGKAFNAQMVKGGMFANVAIRISAWEFDGDEGVSIYLQGVQIDTSKPSLNFGGGKSVKQMFNRDGDDEESDDESDDQSSDQDTDEDDDDQPRSKKSKARPSHDEDEDESDDEESEDESDEDDEDEAPKKKGKKSKRNFDEDEE